MSAPNRLWRVLIAVFVAVPGAVSWAAPVSAAPVGCVQQFWLYELRGTTRTICDGPIQADGSWIRGRDFYGPAYWQAGYCSRSWCSLGYPVPEFNKRDVYVVTPSTVLPDEPGWIAP